LESRLDGIFSLYERWLTSYRKATPVLQRTREIHDVKSWRDNPITAELLRSLCYAEHPWPDMCSPPVYRNLFAISWQARSKLPVNNLNYFEKRVPSFSCHAVYRATLRRLQTWVLGRRLSVKHRIGESTAIRFQMKKNRWGEVNVRQWTPKELAYMLLRSYEPGGRQWSIHSDVQYAVHPQQTARVFHGDFITSRADLRARILRDYIGLLHHLTGRDRHRYQFVPDIVRRARTYVLTYEELNSDSGWESAIIFPSFSQFPDQTCHSPFRALGEARLGGHQLRVASVRLGREDEMTHVSQPQRKAKGGKKPSGS
ncbi:MAG TPA: hypothetical protein VJ577_20290, partial [Burkholderiaceae bacterium]|nr:hypothetical protein [Burkholderiaceae bacterium]